VVVNHRVTAAPNGKTTSTPLSNDEVEKLTALVQEAIGFNKERGDSVKLINVPFRIETLPKAADLPLWKQDEFIDLVRSAATPAAIVLVSLLIVLGLVRPALKAAVPASAGRGAKLNVVADEPLALPAGGAQPMLEAPRNEERLAGARAMARDNPAAVASIVRHWAKGEAS
jgi:flagellar M-ring protein FliF